MTINKNELIDIYNENEGDIFSISKFKDEGLHFLPAEDGKPSVEPLSFEEIDFINKKSDIFKNLTLRIDPEFEDEVFKQLRINVDREKQEGMLSNDEIKDLIVNANTEKIERIIKIKSIVVIEKIRNMLIKLDNEGEYDIVKRVYEAVNARYAELSRGRLKTNLVVKTVKNEKKSIDKKKKENKKDTKEE